MTGSAVGRVLIDGRDTGSGFAIADYRALSAGHVVRCVTERIAAGDQLPVVEPAGRAAARDRGAPGSVRAGIEYQPEGAEPIPVTRVQVNTSLDVALLHLQQPAPAVLPAGPITAGAKWRVETRPKASDPTLTGTVTDPQRRLQNQRGEETTLIQLRVREELGDYRGYSGSPVTSLATGRVPDAVIGVLVEQGRWRISTLGQPAPVTNVLFAAPIDRVLTEFGLTNTGILLDEVAPTTALQLLAGWTATPVRQLPPEAAQVAQECAYLPLALALCGAVIATGGHSWPQLLDLLRHADPDALHSRLVDYPHRSLAAALKASIDTLPPDTRTRYVELAVFEGEGPVPLAAVQVLWEFDQRQTTTLVGELADRSLLYVTGRHVSLHDLQMDYLIRIIENLPVLHDQLLAAYAKQCRGGWVIGPDDGYFYQHLAHQLHSAGRLLELKALLLDPEWMHAKLTSRTVPELLADYDTLPSDPAIRLVAEALRRSAHTLAADSRQLPSQLVGRLAGQPDRQVQDLLRRIRRWPANPWLCPLTPSLTPPGGPLLRAVTGHYGNVSAVGISADGQRAVSAGDRDRKVRVWDLTTGEELHTLTGLRYGATAVAVSADGQRAVSGSYRDGTVRVWDLTTGEELHSLIGSEHSLWVSAVAVSADGQRVVSILDQTVQVWDLTTPVTLSGTTTRSEVPSRPSRSRLSRQSQRQGWRPRSLVSDALLSPHRMAVSSDGQRAIVVDSDSAIAMWDLTTGEELSCLPGCGIGGGLNEKAVAVSADGRRAVSGGELFDMTARVWDLTTGEELRLLNSERCWFKAIAIDGDGQRAVSAGYDGTVRVWDLTTGEELASFVSDSQITAFAASSSGTRMIAGTFDGQVHLLELCESG